MAMGSKLVVVAALTGALFAVSAPCLAQPAGGAPTQRRLTLAFSNALVADVMDRLRQQGVNFVLADRNVQTDLRITLNLAEQPEEEAMYALGEALGGHWERRGSVYLFRRGAGSPSPASGGGTAPVAQPAGATGTAKTAEAKPAPPRRRKVSPTERIVVSYTQAAPIGSAMKTFLDSLTSNQLALHARQGYLRLSDLAIRQRKLLGGMNAVRGRLDIRLSGDEESVTIKSDPATKGTKKSPKRPARRTGARRRG